MADPKSNRRVRVPVVGICLACRTLRSLRIHRRTQICSPCYDRQRERPIGICVDCKTEQRLAVCKREQLCGRCRDLRRRVADPTRRAHQMRQWRAANSERDRANRKSWMAANHDKVREQTIESCRRWRQRHREEISKQERAKRMADPQRKQKRRRYAAANRQRLNEIQRRHRLASKTYYAHVDVQRRLRRRGAAGTHSVSEWSVLKLRYGNRCAYCGRHPDRLTKDHRLPICRGGSNDIGNILPCCGSCNSSKNTLTTAEFLWERHRNGIRPSPTHGKLVRR